MDEIKSLKEQVSVKDKRIRQLEEEVTSLRQHRITGEGSTTGEESNCWGEPPGRNQISVFISASNHISGLAFAHFSSLSRPNHVAWDLTTTTTTPLLFFVDAIVECQKYLSFLLGSCTYWYKNLYLILSGGCTHSTTTTTPLNTLLSPSHTLTPRKKYVLSKNVSNKYNKIFKKL